MEKQVQELENGREDLVGVFRVNGSTTATLHATGEVTIRQVRKRAVPRDLNFDPTRASADDLPGRAGMRVETEEVLIKLAAVDFARIARVVAQVHGG